MIFSEHAGARHREPGHIQIPGKESIRREEHQKGSSGGGVEIRTLRKTVDVFGESALESDCVLHFKGKAGGVRPGGNRVSLRSPIVQEKRV